MTNLAMPEPQSTPLPLVRNVLEEIQQNSQEDCESYMNHSLEENLDDDSDLTELERQIVAKYLSELEGSEEDSAELTTEKDTSDQDNSKECDLNNNNCKDNESHQEKGAIEEQAQQEDKENILGKNFPTTIPKEELMAVTQFLRQFPQLSRRTSLESSTGDSVEDLVSACPQLVHFLRQHVATAAKAATATCSLSAQHAPGSSSCNSSFATSNNNQNSVASQVSHTSSSTAAGTSNAADATRYITNTPTPSSTAQSASYCCDSAINREESRINGPAERGALNVLTGTKKTDKTVKKRPNYSVWMGVTSCIWGLLFFLMKKYL